MNLDSSFINTLTARLSEADPNCEVSIGLRSLSTQLTLDIAIVRHPLDLSKTEAETAAIEKIRQIAYREISSHDEATTSSHNFKMRIGIHPDYWSHRLRARFPEMQKTTYQLLANRIGQDPKVTDLEGNPIGELMVARPDIHLYTTRGPRKIIGKPRAAAMLRHETRFILITADQKNPDSAIILPPISK